MRDVPRCGPFFPSPPLSLHEKEMATVLGPNDDPDSLDVDHYDEGEGT